MSARPITLTRHIMTKKATTIPVADLGLIMERLELIGKRIARELTIASLGGELGYTGATNVQGEQVKKLDEWGNDVFLEAFEHGQMEQGQRHIAFARGKREAEVGFRIGRLRRGGIEDVPGVSEAPVRRPLGPCIRGSWLSLHRR